MFIHIIMAHFLPTLSLVLSISTAASVVIPEVTGTACSLQTNPTNSPAWNIPTYCSCGDAGAYPTITPTASQSAPTGNQFCEYVESKIPSVIPITPTPFTCNLESAATGFTVPNRWCGCTAGTSTSTYSTKFSASSPTGTGVPAPCDFMQDELPIGTISPTAAHCIVASATPGGTFYDKLAWCACADNAPHPLIPATSAACAYTTVPSSTITPSPIASTSCQLSSVFVSNSYASFCECDGAGTTARYATSTIGNDACVFSTVPTTTATLPSLIGSGAGYPSCYYHGTCHGCDSDGQTIVSSDVPPTGANASANESFFKVSVGKQAGSDWPTYLFYKTCPDGFTCSQIPGDIPEDMTNTVPDCVPLFPSLILPSLSLPSSNSTLASKSM